MPDAMIRHLSMQDIPQVVTLGQEMHEESRYAALYYDALKAKRIAEETVRMWGQLGLVAEEQGEIYAMFGGYVCEYEYGKDLVAYDRLLYVSPQHRGSMVAVRMILQYVRWATSVGAKQIYLGQSTGVNYEMVDALYRRLGFEYLGGCYRKG